MKTDTRLYALFGNPVAHSLSPLMHNAAYRGMKLNARYTAFRKKTAAEIIRAITACDIRGASITLPHKTAVINHIHSVSESAEKIGAVNTLSVNNGAIAGDNTDWTGFVRAIEEVTSFSGHTFVVLGAGGVARAALYGIVERGGRPVVVNRTRERGEQLAREFECEFIPLAEVAACEGHCLVNCTSVGMYPATGRSPLDGTDLPRVSFVMDMIYNPLDTKLLSDARRAGITTLSGLSMFVHQGAEQIRLWTNREPPVDVMYQIVERTLTHDSCQ